MRLSGPFQNLVPFSICMFHNLEHCPALDYIILTLSRSVKNLISEDDMESEDEFLSTDTDSTASLSQVSIGMDNEPPLEDEPRSPKFTANEDYLPTIGDGPESVYFMSDEVLVIFEQQATLY